MKKWVYFIPYVLYNFFIKRKKGDVETAYFYTLFVITFFMIIMPLLILKIDLLTVREKGINNLFIGIAEIAFYIFILKLIIPRKKIEVLVFSKKEFRIANIVVACYFLIPLMWFLFFLIKALIPTK